MAQVIVFVCFVVSSFLYVGAVMSFCHCVFVSLRLCVGVSFGYVFVVSLLVW